MSSGSLTLGANEHDPRTELFQDIRNRAAKLSLDDADGITRLGHEADTLFGQLRSANIAIPHKER